MQTTQTTCDHCKKQRDRTDCKFVTIQRYDGGRYKNVSVLVCTDTCSGYYFTRQAIKTLQRRLQAQQRRPSW